MNELIPIEHNDQRVLTTAQLAEGYGTESGVISKNFNNNKERYIEGKHYYKLGGNNLKEFFAKVNFTSAKQGRFIFGRKKAHCFIDWRRGNYEFSADL